MPVLPSSLYTKDKLISLQIPSIMNLLVAMIKRAYHQQKRYAITRNALRGTFTTDRSFDQLVTPINLLVHPSFIITFRDTKNRKITFEIPASSELALLQEGLTIPTTPRGKLFLEKTEHQHKCATLRWSAPYGSPYIGFIIQITFIDTHQGIFSLRLGETETFHQWKQFLHTSQGVLPTRYDM